MQNKNEFQTLISQNPYFGVTNLGGFSAVIYASYTLNGENFFFNSGTFTLFFYKEIEIPTDATNIHLYVLINNGLGEWAPVYNNNLSSAGIVELKLYGTIWDPYAAIIKDPNPTHLKVSASNNAGFITKFKVTYTFNKLNYELESRDFSSGVIRTIDIPSSATDIFVKAEYFSGAIWLPLYQKTFPKASNVQLNFWGTVMNPQFEEIVNPGSNNNQTIKKEALVICAKKPHKNKADLNDSITFAINITNLTSILAKNVVLKENLPAELEFIENSLKINGVQLHNFDFSSFTMNLGDIQMYSSLLITYKVKIVSIPKTNQIMYPSKLNFSYLNENNELKHSSSTGATISLWIGDINKPNNCCCYHSNCEPKL